MSLLAEELVEEWLNRQGYFTIRGIKAGVHEIDLLAIGPVAGGIQARHIEVQASVNPISYLAPLTKADQLALGRAPYNARARTVDQMRAGMREWVQKKFYDGGKEALRQSLYGGRWELEFVIHKVKYEDELSMLEAEGIKVWRLAEVVRAMSARGNKVKGAAGSSLLDLIILGGEL